MRITRKLIESISVIIIFSLVFSLSFGVTSCTKEVQVRDTLVIKDTALSTQILTANPWKLQEYKGVVGGSVVNYVRGGTNNNVNFDREYIVFKQDKTGTYYDLNNAASSLTWNFANSDSTKIIYTVNFPNPGPTVVTWDNIRYKNGSIYYDQFWAQGDLNSHTQNIRIPK